MLLEIITFINFIHNMTITFFKIIKNYIIMYATIINFYLIISLILNFPPLLTNFLLTLLIIL